MKINIANPVSYPVLLYTKNAMTSKILSWVTRLQFKERHNIILAEPGFLKIFSASSSCLHHKAPCFIVKAVFF